MNGKVVHELCNQFREVALIHGHMLTPQNIEGCLSDIFSNSLALGDVKDVIERCEPPREKWRLRSLRGWSHDNRAEISAGDTRTGGEDGRRTRPRVSNRVGGNRL